MRVLAGSSAFLLASLLLLGCPGLDALLGGGGGDEFTFEDAMEALGRVDERYASPRSVQELEEYADAVESVWHEQGAELSGEDKEAFEAFVEYRQKEIEATVALYDVSEETNPARLNSERDVRAVEGMLENVGATADALDEALDALSEFESDYPQFAGSTGAGEEKQELLGFKGALVGIQTEVQNTLETMPQMRAPEGGERAVDFEAAKQIVLDELVKGEPALVYSKGTLLAPGTEVHHFGPPEIGTLVWTTDNPVWFFWIDDLPPAMFAHPARFVFVEKNTGEYIVFEEEWWPVIDGQSWWSSEIVEYDDSDLVYGDPGLLELGEAGSEADHVPLKVISLQAAGGGAAGGGGQPPLKAERTPCPCGQPSKLYALLIQGHNDSMFEKSAKDINTALKGRGFGSANIHYLGQPMNNSPHDVDIDANTSKATIKQAIADINSTIRCCDVLFVYFNGHGGLSCQITWTNSFTSSVTF